MGFLKGWWHLRISCIQICSYHQRDSEQVQGGLQVFVGRQGILVGLGKLNLACWAWQNRDWGEIQSQHCGCGAGSSYKLTRNKFRLEIQEVCPMARSSSFLGLWPHSLLWAELSLIGLGGLLAFGGWAAVAGFPVSLQFSKRTCSPRLALYRGSPVI